MLPVRASWAEAVAACHVSGLFFPPKNHHAVMYTGTANDRIWCGTSRRSNDCMPLPKLERSTSSHFPPGNAGDAHLNKILKQPISNCFCRMGDAIKGVKLQATSSSSSSFSPPPPPPPQRLTRCSVCCLRFMVPRALHQRAEILSD